MADEKNAKTEKVPYEEFVRKFILAKRNLEFSKGINPRIPATKGDYNLITAMDSYYKGTKDYAETSANYIDSQGESQPVKTGGQSVIQLLAQKGKLTIVPRTGGVMVYLPEDKPTSNGKLVAVDTITKDLGI